MQSSDADRCEPMAPRPESGDWLRGSPKLVAVLILGSLVAVGAWMTIAPIGRAPGQEPGQAIRIADVLATTPRAERARGRLDLNTASQAELELLPGIGPRTATRIIEFRSQVRAIRDVDELLNVKGIGRRTVERLRPLVDCVPLTSAGPDDAP